MTQGHPQEKIVHCPIARRQAHVARNAEDDGRHEQDVCQHRRLSARVERALVDKGLTVGTVGHGPGLVRQAVAAATLHFQNTVEEQIGRGHDQPVHKLASCEKISF